VIRLRGLYKTFEGKNQVHALRGIDLDIPKGQVFGVIGQSGAGKSTLVRCINLLERPTSGQIWVDDTEVTSLSSRQLRSARKRMGMIFQHFNLLSSRTAAGNIAYPLELAGADKTETKTRVEEMLKLVGLEDKAHAYPAQLSGGQKQRVGIARALANEPQVLLCDEATSALDPETTKSVLQLLKEINQQMGLTIVLITHEMPVIQEICDMVAVLEHGIIQEEGRVIDVFTKPKSQATRRMLQDTMEVRIPPDLLQRPEKSNGDCRRILKLSFVGPGAHEPLISDMVKRHPVNANILFGRIDQMKDIPFGMLLLEISGEADLVDQAVNYLQSQDVEVEVFQDV